MSHSTDEPSADLAGAADSDRDDLAKIIASRLIESGLSSGAAQADRPIAEVCLRAIVQHGFDVRRKPRPQQASEPDAPSTTSEASTAKSIDHTIDHTIERAIDLADRPLRDLLDAWRDVSQNPTSHSAASYAALGETILRSGHPLIAYDVVESGLRVYSAEPRLLQLKALALARCGAPQRAAKLLTKLYDEGRRDAETLGLLARTNKDLWESTTDPVAGRRFLQEAHRLYALGYAHARREPSDDGRLYTGINAATTAFLLGDEAEAVRLATEVAAIACAKADPDYWTLATLAESALIRRRLSEAAQYYSAACAKAGRKYADIASTKRNAGLLLEQLGEPSALLANWFPLPSVVVFTGHRLDAPRDDGTRPRFDPRSIDRVSRELEQLLHDCGAAVGYAGAASGGDLIFLKALRNRGGDCHLVLPLPPEVFVAASVDDGGEHDWRADFKTALEFAAKTVVVSDFGGAAEPLHYEYANHVMTGLAILHAQALGAELIPVAVWDERPSLRRGGTGTLVEYWRKIGLQPRIINPTQPTDERRARELRADSPSQVDDAPRPTDSFPIEIRAMLFADVVGYSKLTEQEIPLFVTEFMGGLSRCIRESGIPVETANTWGDALYFVFRNAEDAGLLALSLAEYVQAIDWKSRGFRTQLNLRTGLHVGPVFRITDPITHTSSHTGSHVSRAARIEPIAPPGEVYASEAFAAVAAADRVASFRCDYVGVTPMAKSYGEFATYHVRRAGK